MRKFAINPGVPKSFPWLSAMATAFETYTVHKLKYTYAPSVSTSTAGSIALAIDYDALDQDPRDKTQMLSYKSSTRSALWQAASLNVNMVDTMGLSRRKFTRDGDVSGDLKTYDVGTLYIYTEGQTSGLLGELWVEYDISLYTPQGGGTSDKNLFASTYGGRYGTDSTDDLLRKLPASATSGNSLKLTTAASRQFITNLIPGYRYEMSGVIESTTRDVDNVDIEAAGGVTDGVVANIKKNISFVGLNTDYPIFNIAFDYLRNTSLSDAVRVIPQNGATTIAVDFLNNFVLSKVPSSSVQ